MCPKAKLAVDLAATRNAKLTVVYIVDPYPYLSISDTNPMSPVPLLIAAHRPDSGTKTLSTVLPASLPGPMEPGCAPRPVAA